MTDSSRLKMPDAPAAIDPPASELLPEGSPDLLRFDQPTVIAQRSPTPIPAISTMSPSDLGKALIGEWLGHFELQEFVGGGGMGAVFKALDTQLGRVVALKVLSRDQSSDEELLRRFRNEAQSAARLDHENIARVYFFGEDRGLFFIVFEFIEGVNVRDLIVRHGPLAWPDAVNFTLQVADALAHASGRDVVHRDIKPSNIIITDSRRAKLVDMGLARLHQVQNSSEDLTASGVTLGTFDYISPEQARDPRSADVRSDIYSLGCTLYFMLSAQPPFPDGTVLQKLLQHQGDEPPDPRQFNPEVPTELCAIVRRMLAKDPRRRYQTPAALIADLMALATRFGVAPENRAPVVAPVLAAERPLRFFERNLPWVAPVTVLLIAVALVELVPLSTDDGWQPPRVAHGSMNERVPAPPTASLADDNEQGAPEDETSASRATRPQAANAPAALSLPGSNSSIPTAPAAESSRLPVTDASRNVVTGQAASLPDEDVSPELNDAADGEVSGSLRQPDRAGGLGPTRSSEAASVARGATDATAAEPTAPSSGTPSAGNPLSTTSEPRNGSSPSESNGNSSSTSRETSTNPADEQLPPRSPFAAALNKRGLLVVSESENGDNVYPTLAAACRAAKMGDVIELRYQGPKVSRPIRLANVALTIRAGAGFRPEIVFAPTDEDAQASSPAMIGVVGGSLTLVNVAISWQVTENVVAELPLALIEAQASQAIRLQQCVLSASIAKPNAEFARPAAFLRILPPPGGNVPATLGAFFGLEPVVVELTDCVARGSATMVEVVAPQTAAISWDNGLLATTERLLHVASEMAAVSTLEIPLDLNLRHVTVAAQRGLILLESTQDEPFNTQLTCRVQDSILLHAPGAVLVDLAGREAKDLQRRRLSWHGDGNFYEGFATFWRIQGNGDADAETYNFRAWQQWWGPTRENQAHADSVAWRKLPTADLPAEQHVLADYALDTAAAANPARASASDGSDAGFDGRRLSPLVLPGKSAVTEQRGNMGMEPLE